ncbi:MAG: histidine--tRNA ligase [Acholeplasmataceae bacterium]|jgi:histidyl-tRNA synthetase|nr:histidine--tRNA ligase [Acholeplasmataceae bacterium]
MIQKPKGTYDLLPEETIKYRALENHLIKLLENYGYEEIRTPIFEHSNVFHRESELSDMVVKETYNFLDKANRSLTLRPEGTAGVIRSYIENKLYANRGITKLFYLGPNFRYERPQKGRYRQFYQFGVEAIGAKSASLDAEIIALSYKIITSLNLKQVKVKINSLGDIASRTEYKKILTNYFLPYKEKLCPDCQNRITQNPIRILDCKIDQGQTFVKNAPRPLEYLTPEALAYFNDVLGYLDSMDIIYEIDDRLVRGLDYYGHTVFEVEAHIKGFGAQNILGGGGHYESLVSELGGPEISGVGVAFGMERLMQAIDAEKIVIAKEQRPDFYLLYFDETTKKAALSLLIELRDLGFKGDIDHLERSFKNQLKQAINYNPKYLIIIGEDELKEDYYTVKDVSTEQQEKLTYEQLIKKLGAVK